MDSLKRMSNYSGRDYYTRASLKRLYYSPTMHRDASTQRVGQTNEKVQEPMAKQNNLASLELPEPNDASTQRKSR